MITSFCNPLQVQDNRTILSAYNMQPINILPMKIPLLDCRRLSIKPSIYTENKNGDKMALWRTPYLILKLDPQHCSKQHSSYITVPINYKNLLHKILADINLLNYTNGWYLLELKWQWKWTMNTSRCPKLLIMPKSHVLYATVQTSRSVS